MTRIGIEGFFLLRCPNIRGVGFNLMRIGSDEPAKAVVFDPCKDIEHWLSEKTGMSTTTSLERKPKA